MAYLTDKDFRALVNDQSMLTLTEDVRDRIQAENSAMEEMASYLRARYDVAEMFKQTGEQRNSLIVMYLTDMAIYHLFAQLEGYEVPTNRVKRYEAAIAWLVDVADGKSNPNLPEYPAEEDNTGITNWGSISKNKNDW